MSGKHKRGTEPVVTETVTVTGKKGKTSAAEAAARLEAARLAQEEAARLAEAEAARLEEARAADKAEEAAARLAADEAEARMLTYAAAAATAPEVVVTLDHVEGIKKIGKYSSTKIKKLVENSGSTIDANVNIVNIAENYNAQLHDYYSLLSTAGDAVFAAAIRPSDQANAAANAAIEAAIVYGYTTKIYNEVIRMNNFPPHNNIQGIISEIDDYLYLDSQGNLHKNLYKDHLNCKYFMAKSIWMWREMRKKKKIAIEISKENKIKVVIPSLELLITLVTVFETFRSDPDTEDIIQAAGDERIKFAYFFYYKLLRVFDLDPNNPLIRIPLKDTVLGKKIIELAEEDDFKSGNNRIYNIVFQAFVFLDLLALIIPNWYNKIPSNLENPITLYIGTKDKSWDANCLNFKINEIDSGTLLPRGALQPDQQFEVFTPISSASPNLAVAMRFKSDDGVIIAIKLGTGCSYVCIDDSSNESEVIVTQGTYIFTDIQTFRYEGKTYNVYNFEQIDSGNFERVKDIANSKWTSWKTQINQAIKDFKPAVIGKKQSSLQRNGTILSVGAVSQVLTTQGGSKSKSKRRRRTNKRRRSKKTNKRKSRRTNKQRRSKRKSRRI